MANSMPIPDEFWEQVRGLAGREVKVSSDRQPWKTSQTRHLGKI